MGVITGIYSGINNLMEFLIHFVTGICAGLPLILNLVVVPVSFVVLFAFGLFLMAWPLWVPLIAFAAIKIPQEKKKVKAQAEEAERRIKTAASKITDKLIPYLHSNYPGAVIERVQLTNNSVIIMTSGETVGTINIKFDKDLNFDVSSLPKPTDFFQQLGDQIIAKYPLPEHKYVATTISTGSKEKLVGYNYSKTVDNMNSNSGQVKLDPITHTDYYYSTTYAIVKKTPANINSEPPKEVL